MLLLIIVGGAICAAEAHLGELRLNSALLTLLRSLVNECGRLSTEGLESGSLGHVDELGERRNGLLRRIGLLRLGLLRLELGWSWEGSEACALEAVLQDVGRVVAVLGRATRREARVVDRAHLARR